MYLLMTGYKKKKINTHVQETASTQFEIRFSINIDYKIKL